MTESLVKFEDFKVATLAPQKLDSVLAEIAENGIQEPELERVKFPSTDETEWRIPDIMEKTGYVRTDEIVGIIVHHHAARSLWLTSFEENPDQPPDCSSKNAREGSFSSASFKKKEDQPSGTCGEGNCKYAEFETALKGEGQACKLMREIFVLLPNKILPVLVSVGPGSVTDTKKFFNNLLSSGMTSSEVMVGLSLYTSKSKAGKNGKGGGVDYPKLKMRVIGPLSAEMQETVDKYKELIKKNL